VDSGTLDLIKLLELEMKSSQATVRFTNCLMSDQRS